MSRDGERKALKALVFIFVAVLACEIIYLGVTGLEGAKKKAHHASDLFDKGDCEASLSAMEKLKPDVFGEGEPRLVFNIARAKYELGKKDEALKIYQRLIKEFDGTNNKEFYSRIKYREAVAHASKAYDYEKMGDQEKQVDEILNSVDALQKSLFLDKNKNDDSREIVFLPLD